MLFSPKYLLAAISVLTLLQGSLARLALVADNDGLERRESYALLEREPIDFDLDTRADVFDEDDLLERRAPQSNAARRARASQPARGRKGLPNAARLTLGKEARKELDGMGLHGKARRNTVKWHKTQLKKEMKTNPALKGKARSGVIEHVAHKGGSNPKEKNHITASFRDKNRKDIPNKFNGGKNHHVYVNNKGLNRAGKAASARNNAQIKGQSKSHQMSVGRTQTPGKSSQKGKEKQRNLSKNSNKGFQRRKRSL
jgi:hypothetical protein